MSDGDAIERGAINRAAYFVVSLDYFGREVPAIYWDELSRERIRRLVYVQRLDRFPNAAELLGASLDKLFSVYLHLKRKNKLPSQWEPPKRPAPPQEKRLFGHREVHPRRHLPDAPIDRPGLANV